METQRQIGFAVGLWEGADQLEDAPPGSVTVANNVFVDPTNVLRSRNGAPAMTGDTSWGGGRLTWCWEGNLIPGKRTLAASAGIPGTPDHVDATHGFAALDPATNNMQSLNDFGPGEDDGHYYLDYPTSWTLMDSMLWIGNEVPDGGDLAKQGMLYGGSLNPNYFAPTDLQVTQDSDVVTSATGGFLANVDVGKLLYVSMPFSAGEYFVVKSVDSNNQVTLHRPWRGVTGTAAISIFTALGYIGINSDPSKTSPSYRASKLYGQCAGRLLSLEGNTLYVSDGPDPDTGEPRPYLFPETNKVVFPLDAQGIALQTIRNQAFIFTSAGLYRITGLEYEITDPDGNPQWTIELLSSETIALSNAAIVAWHQALIVPCVDAIYIIDGVNPPTPITLGVDWQAVANAGVQLGQATVHQGYYLLPVEKGTVAGAGKQEFTTYCFRLTPVQSARGIVFPNTRWTCDVEGYYSAGPNRLIVAGNILWDGGKVLDPVANGNGDGDGSLIGTTIRSRPFPIGEGSVVLRVRARMARSGGIPNFSVWDQQGGSASCLGDLPGAQKGDRWIAYDLFAPKATPEPMIQVFLLGPNRGGLLGLELQYRAAGLPAGF